MTTVTDYYERADSYRMSSTREKKVRELLGSVSGKTILDVGCASGSSGQKLKADGAHVFGIDIAESAVEKAKKVLDGAFVCDVENEELPGELRNRQFDVILPTEFLEHLFRPEIALRKLKPLLKRDGFLIITTPNFLLWSNRIRMFFGQFRYQEGGGFLDRGHVHFFTRPTLLELLSNEGFVVEKENNLIHPNWFGPIGRFFPNLFAYQLILKAHPR